MSNDRRLVAFERYDFYEINQTYSLDDRNNYIKLKPQGVDLAARYYAKKSQLKIKFFDFADSKDPLTRYDPCYYLYLINEYLAEKKPLKNEREALYINKKLAHARAIFYLKEDDEEILLVTDSTDVSCLIAAEIKKRPELTALNRMPIYATTPNHRQADSFSCFTDALIFAKDITASAEEKYYIKDLIKKIKQRAIASPEEKYWITQLPDELLKTAQLADYVKLNKEAKSSVIHSHKGKNEMLGNFRKRYTDEEGKACYLRIKGYKLADIIEIQFYIEQLQNLIGNQFTETLKNEFFVKAKAELKAQGYVTTHQDRKGLFTFVEDFLQEKREHAATVMPACF